MALNSYVAGFIDAKGKVLGVLPPSWSP